MLCIWLRRGHCHLFAHLIIMHSSLAIVLISAALIAPAFGQEKKFLTLDELVTRNIEAKGGAAALSAL